MKNANYKTHQVKTRCENKLEIEFREGRSPHFNGWFKFNNKKIARIIVPKGRKTIPKGTYKSMANSLKLEVEQFDDLLDCPLQLDGYIDILRSQKFILD